MNEISIESLKFQKKKFDESEEFLRRFPQRIQKQNLNKKIEKEIQKDQEGRINYNKVIEGLFMKRSKLNYAGKLLKVENLKKKANNNEEIVFYYKRDNSNCRKKNLFLNIEDINEKIEDNSVIRGVSLDKIYKPVKKKRSIEKEKNIKPIQNNVEKNILVSKIPRNNFSPKERKKISIPSTNKVIKIF